MTATTTAAAEPPVRTRRSKLLRWLVIFAVLAGSGVGVKVYLGRQRLTWRASYEPWSADSPWRRPATGALLHPQSAQMITDLYSRCGTGPDGPCKFPRLAGAPDGKMLGSGFGVAVYVADASTPHYVVSCFKYVCGDQSTSGEQLTSLVDVPIPRGARPDPSSDAQLVVYDPAHAAAWDLWNASYDSSADTWKAGGGIRWDLSTTGVDTPGEAGSAVGGGSALLGSVLRPEEVRRALADGTGVVSHLLSGGYSAPRRDCFVGPFAKKSDGKGASRWAIPEGAILRLDPSVNISSLGLNPAEAVIARTLQRFGMVIRDDSGSFSIDVETVSVEDGAEPGRSALWRSLDVRKNSLRALQGSMFQVLAWDPARAHGANCL
jgi:hypothetical protein